MAGEARGRARPAAALHTGTGDAPRARSQANGRAGRSLAGHAPEEPRQRAQRAVAEKIVTAERDGSAREDLFRAIRRAVGMKRGLHPHDPELVVRMVTVLLDAGRPLHLNEASRRVRERWGSHFGESALYAAKFSGAMREDMYGVLYLQRPAVDGRGMGEDWMYMALERAVELGAARYTDAGIEVAAAAKLTPREVAGAEAVARGVGAHGEPPGLAAWLDETRGDGRRVTWAEATVAARGARAEVGAAYAQIAGERA